jgi:hypothetical protein
MQRQRTHAHIEAVLWHFKMVSTLQTWSRKEIQAVIRYLYAKKVPSDGIHRQLVVMYGETVRKVPDRWGLQKSRRLASERPTAVEHLNAAMNCFWWTEEPLRGRLHQSLDMLQALLSTSSKFIFRLWYIICVDPTIIKQQQSNTHGGLSHAEVNPLTHFTYFEVCKTCVIYLYSMSHQMRIEIFRVH